MSYKQLIECNKLLVLEIANLSDVVKFVLACDVLNVCLEA